MRAEIGLTAHAVYRAARLVPRTADVGSEYVDSGDVDADHPGRPLSERPVVGIDGCGDVFDGAESIA